MYVSFPGKGCIHTHKSSPVWERQVDCKEQKTKHEKKFIESQVVIHDLAILRCAWWFHVMVIQGATWKMPSLKDAWWGLSSIAAHAQNSEWVIPHQGVWLHYLIMIEFMPCLWPPSSWSYQASTTSLTASLAFMSWQVVHKTYEFPVALPLDLHLDEKEVKNLSFQHGSSNIGGLSLSEEATPWNVSDLCAAWKLLLSGHIEHKEPSGLKHSLLISAQIILSLMVSLKQQPLCWNHTQH